MKNKPHASAAYRTFQGYVFDQSKANRATRFIEACCILSKGKDAGKPLKLRPWQRKIIEEIFGWIDPKTGLRRYRTVFLFLSRKNGKSHLASAISAMMLYGTGEKGAEVILAANSRDQASICYKAVSGMVRQSPELDEISDIIGSTKHIYVESTNSTLKVVSADATTALGLDISCLVYDEICFSPNRDLYDALTTASGSREEALQVFISTAGWDHQGVGYQLYQYAKTVLADPSLDPTFLPVIFELPEGADWADESLWPLANPALGDFLKLDTLRNECRKAVNNPSEQGKFRMFHMNQFVNAAESWLSVSDWQACADRNLELDSLKEYDCWLGLDLSAVDDLTAVTAVWQIAPNRYYIKPYIFLPGDGLRERCRRDKVPYDAWSQLVEDEEPELLLTPGKTVDYDFIEAKISNLCDRFNVKGLGFDSWQSKTLIPKFEEKGLLCVKVRQGHESLGSPTKEFQRMILSKQISHDGNRCMDWQIGNVVTRPDANANIVPDKVKSRNRMDSVQAAIIAFHCILRLAPTEPTKPAPEFRMHVLG